MKRKLIKLGTYVGRVITQDVEAKAVRVRVQKMELDSYLTMYFNKRYHYWAHDPDEKSKTGDLILISPLDNPRSVRVHHQLKEVIFELGNTIDPVTGRRCRGPNFVDTETRRFQTVESFTKKTEL